MEYLVHNLQHCLHLSSTLNKIPGSILFQACDVSNHPLVCCKTAQNLLHFISSAGGNCSTLGRALDLFLTSFFKSQLGACH